MEPLMRLRLRFLARDEGASVMMDWIWGRDRGIVDGFWKFMISKAGLLGKSDEIAIDAREGGAARVDGEISSVVQGVGGGSKTVGWNRGGRRGRGRISQSRRFKEDTRDSGWSKAAPDKMSQNNN
jgi:hypothetical protein